MTRYTVVWWQTAHDELTQLWLESPARRQITKAVSDIDRLLAARADSIGDEVHEGLRRLEVGPLRVQFSVERDDRLVRVWSVRMLDP